TPASRYPTMGESFSFCVTIPSTQAAVKAAAMVVMRGRSCMRRDCRGDARVAQPRDAKKCENSLRCQAMIQPAIRQFALRARRGEVVSAVGTQQAEARLGVVETPDGEIGFDVRPA